MNRTAIGHRPLGEQQAQLFTSYTPIRQHITQLVRPGYFLMGTVLAPSRHYHTVQLLCWLPLAKGNAFAERLVPVAKTDRVLRRFPILPATMFQCTEVSAKSR